MIIQFFKLTQGSLRHIYNNQFHKIYNWIHYKVEHCSTRTFVRGCLLLVVSRDKFLLFSVLKVVFVLIIIIIIIFFKSCARVFVIYFVYEPKITYKNKKKLIVEKLLLVHFNLFFFNNQF